MIIMISVIALFIVTALAVSMRNAPNICLFLAALACALFIFTLTLRWFEQGQPSLTSVEFCKTFAALVILTLFGAAAGASARQGK